MFTRKINYLFLYALTIVFVVFAASEQHVNIILSAFYSAAVCIVIYIFGWLTLDGVKSAWIVGWIVFGLGGLPLALLLLLFFLSSSLVSKDLPGDDNATRESRRDARQVWANGFWLALFAMVYFTTGQSIWLFAGIASIAVATADTWATEIGGHRIKGKTYLISTFQPTNPGTDGGISIAGSLAGLSGSLLIAAGTWFLIPEAAISTLIFIAVAGFLGSLADSLMGALIQGTYIELPLPLNALFCCTVDNDFVNWASTGIGSLIFLIFSLTSL